MTARTSGRFDRGVGKALAWVLFGASFLTFADGFGPHDDPAVQVQTSVRLKSRILLPWTPPTLTALGGCGGPICGWAFAKIKARHAGDGDAAWSEYGQFYRGQLCRGLDERSEQTVRHMLDIGYGYFKLEGRAPVNRPSINILDQSAWEKERSEVGRKFPFVSTNFPEIWFQHHGLRFLSERVKHYVSERDILDIGASGGDSLSILDNYTTRRIFSYEPSPGRAQSASTVAGKFSQEKHFVFNLGLSNCSSVVSITESGNGPASFQSTGNTTVHMTTIDEEAGRLNFTVGFIKADTEGAEIDVILGGLETIKRDRPVISMSIYHNEEFLDLPKLLASLGYQLRFFYGAFMHLHYEANVIAIPPELEPVCVGHYSTSVISL
jgi:FkbM family methyltransferase